MKVKNVQFFSHVSIDLKENVAITVFIPPFEWVEIDYTEAYFIFKSNGKNRIIQWKKNAKIIYGLLLSAIKDNTLFCTLDGIIEYRGRSLGVWHSHLMDTENRDPIKTILYAKKIQIAL